MKTRPLSKGEQSRRKMIRTAIRLTARHGFTETSFQMIADACGLSQSAVLYHFRSKNGLIEEVVKTIVSHNHELVSSLMGVTDDAAARLLKHCRGNVLWAVDYREDAQILLLLYYLSCFDADFNRIHAAIIARGRERILAHLLAGRREGLFRLRAEPLLVAEMLQDSLFGAMFYAAAAPRGTVREDGLDSKWRRVLSAYTGHSY